MDELVCGICLCLEEDDLGFDTRYCEEAEDLDFDTGHCEWVDDLVFDTRHCEGDSNFDTLHYCEEVVWVVREDLHLRKLRAQIEKRNLDILAYIRL